MRLSHLRGQVLDRRVVVFVRAQAAAWRTKPLAQLFPLRSIARMDRRQRIMIELSVQILRAAVEASGNGRVDTLSVRLSLRVLLPHCPELWPLVMFWDAAAQDNDIGRSQGVTAAFNGIVRQLRRSGVWREQAP
jgi:hypothetical protein